jgi:hypothetical protein
MANDKASKTRVLPDGLRRSNPGTPYDLLDRRVAALLAVTMAHSAGLTKSNADEAIGIE